MNKKAQKLETAFNSSLKTVESFHVKSPGGPMVNLSDFPETL